MSKKKFSANSLAQPIYQAMNAAIKGLSHEETIAVLEECAAHAEAMIEGERSDMQNENDG